MHAPPFTPSQKGFLDVSQAFHHAPPLSHPVPCVQWTGHRLQPIDLPTQIPAGIDSISYVTFHLSLLEVLLNFLGAASILNQTPPYSGDTAAVSFYRRARDFSNTCGETHDVFCNLSLGTLSLLQPVPGALGTQQVSHSSLTHQLAWLAQVP